MINKPLNISLFPLSFICLTLISHAHAQVVKWYTRGESDNKQEATLTITAVPDKGWHVYSQFMEEGGPLPTSFSFETSKEYSLVGRVEEKSKAVKFYDSTFMIDIAWFSGVAVFSQKIRPHSSSAIIKGKIKFMACNNQMCLPPDEQEFSVEIKPYQESP